MSQQTHELKTWPSYFEAIASGVKTFELRRDDREFAVGDRLRLIEFNPTAQHFTGREAEREVVYVLRDAEGFGLKTGFVILGLRRPPGARLVQSDLEHGSENSRHSPEAPRADTAQAPDAIAQSANPPPVL